MKILLVVGEMDVGGAETHVFMLGRALKRLGNEVVIASSGGRLARKLTKYRIRHVTLPLKERKIFSIIFAEIQLRKLIKEKGFDIVHAHSRLAAFISSFALRGTDSVFVTTVHAKFKDDIFLSHLSRWGRNVIAVSDDLRRYLLSQITSLSPKRVSVIPNGVDTVKFKPMKKRSGKRRITFLSRLDSDCSVGAYALCAISERLCLEFNDLEILLCGGGSEYENIRKISQISNQKIGRSAIMLSGELDADEVPDVLRKTDVFVGVSRAAIEAMSCGIPVILGGNEGFLGILDEQTLKTAAKTNFCCRGSKSMTNESLYTAIRSLLLANEETKARLSSVLRTTALEEYSAEIMGIRTAAFYRDALKKASQSGGALLCGYYGFGNMGDDALLLSAVERAKIRLRDIPIRALTANGSRDSEKFDLPCRSRSNPLSVIGEIRKARVVIFGGGTLFQCSTSRRSSWYYATILLLCRALGVRSELWGNGVEEIRGVLTEKLVAKALSTCGRVGVRDKESAARVKRLTEKHGFRTPPIRLECDLALGRNDTDELGAERFLLSVGIPKDKKYAVVVLRGRESEKYLMAMEKTLRQLRKNGILTVFAVMFPREDLKCSYKMSKRLGGAIAHPLDEKLTRGIMKRATVVIGMRYHALVFAHCVGVPFVGVGRETKIRSFCKANGGAYMTLS